MEDSVHIGYDSPREVIETRIVAQGGQNGWWVRSTSQRSRLYRERVPRKTYIGWSSCGVVTHFLLICDIPSMATYKRCWCVVDVVRNPQCSEVTATGFAATCLSTVLSPLQSAVSVVLGRRNRMYLENGRERTSESPRNGRRGWASVSLEAVVHGFVSTCATREHHRNVLEHGKRKATMMMATLATKTTTTTGKTAMTTINRIRKRRWQQNDGDNGEGKDHRIEHSRNDDDDTDTMTTTIKQQRQPQQRPRNQTTKTTKSNKETTTKRWWDINWSIATTMERRPTKKTKPVKTKPYWRLWWLMMTMMMTIVTMMIMIFDRQEVDSQRWRSRQLRG